MQLGNLKTTVMKKIVLSSAILLFASAFSYFGMSSKAGNCPKDRENLNGYCVDVNGPHGGILYSVCVAPESMPADCTREGGTRVIGLEF